MENFIHHIPTKILFGEGKVSAVGREIKNFGGTKVLLMYGKQSIKDIGLYDQVVHALEESKLPFVELPGIKANPSIDRVRDGQQLIKEHGVDFILAVGGGSVIDSAKAVAAAAFYDGDPWDFFIKDIPVTDGILIGTILTLAATGSEMNNGGVLSNEEAERKLAFGSPLLRPVFSIEDPTLTYSLPQYQTAAGATDIMSHLLEQYFTSHEDEGLQDRMTEAMMINVIDFAHRALKDSTDYKARANLMWTSTLALNGMLTNGRASGDWSTHRIEHEVSAIYDITHGAGLAILYPHVLTCYLEKDLQQHKTLTKFVHLAKNVFKLTGEDEVVLARQAIAELRAFFTSLGMPQTLSDEGVGTERIDEMAEKAYELGLNNVYHTLSVADIAQIYHMSA